MTETYVLKIPDKPSKRGELLETVADRYLPAPQIQHSEHRVSFMLLLVSLMSVSPSSNLQLDLSDIQYSIEKNASKPCTSSSSNHFLNRFNMCKMTSMGNNLQHLYIFRVFRNDSAIMDKARQFNSCNFRRANHQASYYWQCKLPHKTQTTHIGLITEGIDQFDLIIRQSWERIFIINHHYDITTLKVATVTKMAIRQAGAFNEKFTNL